MTTPLQRAPDDDGHDGTEVPALPLPARTIEDGTAPVPPHVVVLFGASGDLAQRKLLPGLFHLFRSGLMPQSRFVATSQEEQSLESYLELVRACCSDMSPRAAGHALDDFTSRFSFVPGSAGPHALEAAVHLAEAAIGNTPLRLHYLAVPPQAVGSVIQTIAQAGLVQHSRIILEKPFGTDLASARALNQVVHEVFDPTQVFHIDHFLGKEAAQNILAFRFANGLFEPIWNRQHIDHIQIDVPEELSVSTRASFYEGTGAFRDMVVTHLFQILAFVAMDPPTSLNPRAINAEKNKVFSSLRPLEPTNVVRGQYEGYRWTDGVAADSETETFVALKCEIDNWRWAGVPFYLRTGKRMAEGARVVSIAFRAPPKSMFPPEAHVGNRGPDHLTFDLADASKMSLSFYGKHPGPGMRLDKLSMQFDSGSIGHHQHALEAYERLLYDAMVGDQTLFATAEGIERLWEVSQPLLDDPPDVSIYRVGSYGPPAMNDLILPHQWRLPFERPWRAGDV